MTLLSVMSGGVTPTGAQIACKVTTGPVRVATSTSPTMTAPTFHGPVQVDAQGAAVVTVTGLSPSTVYHWQVEDAGGLDVSVTGRLKTHPPLGEPGDWTIALYGDSGLDPDVPGHTGAELAPNRISNHPVYDQIRGHPSDPLFDACLGDITYYDPGSGLHVPDASLGTYRTMWDDLAAQPRWAQLRHHRPLVLIKDDHEFGGNDSDGSFPFKGNWSQVFRERVGCYPLPDLDGADYREFPVSRTLMVVCDTRYHREPGVTMLGAAQKAWLAGVLAASTAEFLVVLMPAPWLGTIADTWGGFPGERTELVELFDGSGGWLPRMSMVSADVHALAISSGPGNPHGGFPVYQVAGIDATPSTAAGVQYDGGFRPGRGQYGTLRVNDSGPQIQVTFTGWVGDTVWNTHSFTVAVEQPPTPPAPVAPPVAVAQVRTRVTTLACELVSGRVIADLRDVSGDVSRVLGAYTSAEATVPIPLGGPGHLGELVFAGTDPFRTMLVTVVNDVPVYAGIVLPQAGGTAAELRLGLVSIEGYLQYRTVQDHTWVDQDEAAVIAAGLLGDAGDVPGLGTGIGLIIDAPPTGTRRNRSYLRKDRKSVYEALQELMAVQGGPEWTVDLDWADARRNRVVKIARVRARIGVGSARPRAVFRSDVTTDATYEYLVDRGGGRYANVVQAYSSGEGADQPESQLAVDAVALASGAPIVERHWQPSSSITTQSVLDEHAAAELARVKDGARTFRIEARHDAYPRYGLDWAIGDDVGFELVGHRHPAGVAGVARAVGFELAVQAGRIRPVLPEPAGPS